MLQLRIGILASLLLVGCTGKPAPAEPPPEAPYEVMDGERLRVRRDLVAHLKMEAVADGDLQGTLQGFGHVSFAPNASYSVRSPFAALVERVHVGIGESVKQGQALATLRSADAARLRADARRLDTTIVASRNAVGRLERLVQEGAASPRELIDERARLDSARAEIAGIRSSLVVMGASEEGADAFVRRTSCRAASTIQGNDHEPIHGG